jgi:hypothetical protein
MQNESVSRQDEPMPRIYWLVALVPLSACAAPDQASFLTGSANALLHPRPLSYSGVTSGTRSFSIVEPKDWREMNRQVSPQTPTGGAQ